MCVELTCQVNLTELPALETFPAVCRLYLYFFVHVFAKSPALSNVKRYLIFRTCNSKNSPLRSQNIISGDIIPYFLTHMCSKIQKEILSIGFVWTMKCYSAVMRECTKSRIHVSTFRLLLAGHIWEPQKPICGLFPLSLLLRPLSIQRERERETESVAETH